jgi:DNA polymerase IV
MDVDETDAKGPKLDLSSLPPIFVSGTHFDDTELHGIEDELLEMSAHLTYDVREARIILSKVSSKRRVQFDLRAKGLWTEEVPIKRATPSGSQHASKRPKLEESEKLHRSEAEAIVIHDSSTASEGEDQVEKKSYPTMTTAGKKKPAVPVRTPTPEAQIDGELFKVLKLEWFERSKSEGKVLLFDDYLTYQARPIEKPTEPTTPPKATIQTAIPRHSPGKAILKRAKEDAPTQTFPHRPNRFGKRKFGQPSKPTTSTGGSWEPGHSSYPQYSQLLHHNTTEQENGDGSSSDSLPEMPDWIKAGIKYACQRLTPAHNPNETFIELLKKIKLARLLTNDEIGVRAYSTSIASLAAYPHKLSSPREILRLPGCETKIANLFVEWKNTGVLKAVEEIEASEELAILKLLYEIWGVGATTAREFYYDKGWRELDDIVEYGWSTLSRVQQIGVKYYDEFQDLIPRAEVEEIGRIIHQHAVKVRDAHMQSLIVGGYRRGKEASGDVDIIVSHPDESKTLDVVNDIVSSLEQEGWITHTLLLSLNSTHRGQQTLPFRTGGGGHGFDSLDKALVVWQDPNWPSKEQDLAIDPKAKNPNIHRRVDIIISSWRTVGCAVVGWSGGTTFQRDLRRYAKNVKGWKFDSSGVRSRVNGEVVDLEGWNEYKGSIGTGKAKTMLEAEKRVFEGMGLTYREPWERCTG